MAEIERAIILMVWGDVRSLPLYSDWRRYERGFTHEGKNYKYSCKFKIENEHLRLKDTNIEHEQVIIDLMH